MFFIPVQKFSEYYSKNLYLHDSLTSIFPLLSLFMPSSVPGETN